MTGIQALERIAPSKAMIAGKCERIEFEYQRHGTLCLIGNFVVTTGALLGPTIGPTRTEDDFASHIERTVVTDPEGSWSCAGGSPLGVRVRVRRALVVVEVWDHGPGIAAGEARRSSKSSCVARPPSARRRHRPGPDDLPRDRPRARRRRQIVPRERRHRLSFRCPTGRWFRQLERPGQRLEHDTRDPGH